MSTQRAVPEQTEPTDCEKDYQETEDPTIQLQYMHVRPWYTSSC